MAAVGLGWNWGDKQRASKRLCVVCIDTPNVVCNDCMEWAIFIDCCNEQAIEAGGRHWTGLACS